MKLHEEKKKKEKYKFFRLHPKLSSLIKGMDPAVRLLTLKKRETEKEREIERNRKRETKREKNKRERKTNSSDEVVLVDQRDES